MRGALLISRDAQVCPSLLTIKRGTEERVCKNARSEPEVTRKPEVRFGVSMSHAAPRSLDLISTSITTPERDPFYFSRKQPPPYLLERILSKAKFFEGTSGDALILKTKMLTWQLNPYEWFT